MEIKLGDHAVDVQDSDGVSWTIVGYTTYANEDYISYTLESSDGSEILEDVRHYLMEEELRDCLHNYGFKEILAGEDDILDDRAELEEWSHDRLPRFDRDYLEDTIHEHLRRLSELTNGYVEDMGRPADVSDYCAHIRFMVEGYVGLSYGGYIETYRGNPNKIVVRFTVYLKQGEVDYLFRGTVEEVAEEINRGPAAGLYFENHLRISELRDWMKKYVKEE